ncbi:anhydro-N-acetylmuramic acid kinase [Gilvimarinus agarilyticus]|uniref:anhydro-N-acetylmuramic acid kinase n=1 Tax=unclassified Gilvimarinus TaxID=2642066 RepID=UPI001C08A9F5|nr:MULTISPECIES: anhydro-N-acetylmuramic acid kinase [unclassified Gilvimarinus]MBU2885361.1 anhydro-N-acetylmuramic acid kinase [Gilvimarinus agarilyticus]MDO6570260.1 anhydro-N-acetylmuramic acid kinase [Gilvimarinus sp. 2_MG-2023]MDO6748257.1 anhydro-N-acetylmuramic acid kinase [Gilvimarinus sp. 1_MG-2023]
MALYIGLMSGTSADGIDAALVDINDERTQLLAHHGHDFNHQMRERIHALCASGIEEIERAGTMDNELGELFAQAALKLLEDAGIAASEVAAIGSHGQTIRHRPPGSVAHPFTLQIADPNIIAARTGITTVADFRRRDMAMGGQGAPLVPAFHRAAFAAPNIDRAIVNIGGIANITWLSHNRPTLGFDTGPGNCLMDAWVGRHREQRYDTNGDWARTGRINTPLLEILLEHPYFALPLPKSTGREDFHLGWLDCQLEEVNDLTPEDVQATLMALSVESIARSIENHLRREIGCEVYICGGGALNTTLIESLVTRLTPHPIASTRALGIDPEWVEAATFAWLAQQTLAGLPGNLPSVTGARKAVVLGGIYPA